MKKISSNENQNTDPTLALANVFWRWFSLSVFALLVAAAIPALSADVFIDEGDTDLAATPVSAPATPDGGKAPASEDLPPAGPGAEIDSTIGELEPSPGMDMAPAISNMDKSNAEKVNELMATPAAGKMQAKKKAKVVKKSAKVSKKSAKKIAQKAKSDKKDKKKKSNASKSKKKSKKTTEITSSKNKKASKIASSNKKSGKRKIASISKFAGGKYVTSSRSCALESSPGAGDSNGMTKSSRKLWVEDSGNTSYYKVYIKGGAAAYVARDCF